MEASALEKLAEREKKAEEVRAKKAHRVSSGETTETQAGVTDL